MDHIIAFSQKLAPLINLTVLLSIIAWIYKIYQSTLDQHKSQIKILESHIKILEERIKAKEDFSIDNAAFKIKQAKEFYENYFEINSKEWLANSVKQLEEEKNQAIKNNTELLTKKLNDEIEDRKKIFEEYNKLKTEFEDLKAVAPIDFIGTYIISGNNPVMYKEHLGGLIKNRGSYSGKLSILLPESTRTFTVRWEITSSKDHQTLIGTGIRISNILAVVFDSASKDERHEAPGVAIFELIGKKILRGKWTSQNEDFYGTEECRKIS